MPSGAAMRFIMRMDLQPRFLMKEMAAEAEPPVASMGSSTMRSRSVMSPGSLQ